MQPSQRISRRQFLSAVGAGGTAGVLSAVLSRQFETQPTLVRDTSASSNATASATEQRLGASSTELNTTAASDSGLTSLSRPNIVLILADDLGWSDLGCFGSEIATPNLDQLAAEGTRFTGFTNNARCCPSRASLLTGLYPTQAGVGWMDEDAGSPPYQGRLNRSCVTLAEVLQSSGYRTGLFGKWHVGKFSNGVIPATRGFELSYGPHKASYFRPVLFRNEKIIGTPRDRDFYLTDAITDEAVAGISDFGRSDAPFFTYVSYTAPHWPLQARKGDIAAYRGRYLGGWDAVREQRFARQRALGLLPGVDALPARDPTLPPWRDAKHREWHADRMAVYAAQVSAVDRGVGRLLRTLDQLGIRENTVVMFLSDNGASNEELHPRSGARTVSLNSRPMRSGNHTSITPGASDTFASYGPAWAHASNTPFKQFKRSTYEGGIATPFIASWRGRGQPGRIDHRLLHVMDVMPTIVELAGATYPEKHHGVRIPPPEGPSFAALLSGKTATDWDDSRRLFWEHEGNRAVRHGQWKLVAPYGKPWELYDMEADRAEQYDLARRHRYLTEQLSDEWGRWAERVGVRPWSPGRRYRV